MTTQTKIVGSIHRTFIKGNKICNSDWRAAFTSEEKMKSFIKELRAFIKSKKKDGDKDNACFDIWDANGDSIVGEVHCSQRVMRLAQKQFNLK